MVAYCFATTQTAEGSVKKGILRMAGTVTGVRFFVSKLNPFITISLHGNPNVNNVIQYNNRPSALGWHF